MRKDEFQVTNWKDLLVFHTYLKIFELQKRHLIILPILPPNFLSYFFFPKTHMFVYFRQNKNNQNRSQNRCWRRIFYSFSEWLPTSFIERVSMIAASINRVCSHVKSDNCVKVATWPSYPCIFIPKNVIEWAWQKSFTFPIVSERLYHRLRKLSLVTLYFFFISIKKTRRLVLCLNIFVRQVVI